MIMICQLGFLLVNLQVLVLECEYSRLELDWQGPGPIIIIPMSADLLNSSPPDSVSVLWTQRIKDEEPTPSDPGEDGH